MALTDAERLRAFLGESIPPGGTASDTLFSEDQINDLLERYGTPAAAQSEGLLWKAAMLSTMVTTVEGSSQRKLSDAHKAVLQQAESVGQGGGGVTRIHRLVRE